MNKRIKKKIAKRVAAQYGCSILKAVVPILILEDQLISTNKLMFDLNKGINQ